MAGESPSAKAEALAANISIAKIKLAVRLDAFGVDYIEGGWPGSNPKDMAFFKDIRKCSLKHAKIAAFGSTRRASNKVSADANVAQLLDLFRVEAFRPPFDRRHDNPLIFLNI